MDSASATLIGAMIAVLTTPVSVTVNVRHVSEQMRSTVTYVRLMHHA